MDLDPSGLTQMDQDSILSLYVISISLVTFAVINILFDHTEL